MEHIRAWRLVALALPLWGTEKIWIVVVGGGVTALALTVLERRGATR